MQSTKKENNKRKASPPKPTPTKQELEIKLLRNEQKVMIELFHAHQDDFEILQGLYTTLKNEHIKICNVLVDSIKNTSNLLKLLCAVQHREDWKPEVRELMEPIKIPINLN